MAARRWTGVAPWIDQRSVASRPVSSQTQMSARPESQAESSGPRYSHQPAPPAATRSSAASPANRLGASVSIVRSWPLARTAGQTPPRAARCSSASAHRSARMADQDALGLVPAREMQIPPTGHSASSRAAIFTPSPCRSVPCGIASPVLIPTRNLMRRSGGWSPSYTGTCCCTLRAQRTAPSMLSKTISSESPPVWTILPPCSSIAGLPGLCGVRAVVRASRHRPTRSDGCSQPCPYRRRQSAFADPASFRSGPMRCSLT